MVNSELHQFHCTYRQEMISFISRTYSTSSTVCRQIVVTVGLYIEGDKKHVHSLEIFKHGLELHSSRNHDFFSQTTPVVEEPESPSTIDLTVGRRSPTGKNIFAFHVIDIGANT